MAEPGGARLRDAAPAPAKASGAGAPHAVLVAVRLVGPVGAEARGRGRADGEAGFPGDRVDAAQQDRPVRVRGEGEGLAALHDAVLGDPAAAPDEAAVLVVAAPHVPAHGAERVVAGPADERAEDGVGVPARHAHPGDVPVRADEGAPFLVGDQRVLARRLRRGKVRGTRRYGGAGHQGPLRSGPDRFGGTGGAVYVVLSAGPRGGAERGPPTVSRPPRPASRTPSSPPRPGRPRPRRCRRAPAVFAVRPQSLQVGRFRLIHDAPLPLCPLGETGACRACGQLEQCLFVRAGQAGAHA